MATTPNLGLTLLEVGQKEKEVTINDGFARLDKSGWMGKLAADPAGATANVGAYYFNTTTSKMRFKIDASTWLQVG